MAKTDHKSHFASSSKVSTPATAPKLYPTFDEMHPSKTQQSTTKQPDSGLRLGFTDATAPKSPGQLLAQGTPTKSRGNFSQPRSSPGFEFKFTRPGQQLGPEAQKLMDDLREEALRIKANLAAESEEDRLNNGGEAVSQKIGNRKMATPKGKAGRFSDVHMAEFKKMDSIAAHPSAHRPHTGRTLPTKPSLKRTKSQANLDEPDTPAAKAEGAESRPGPAPTTEESSPAKRAKQRANEDTSSTRPSSQAVKAGAGRNNSTATSRTRYGLPSAIMTPTKASMARSASAKLSKTFTPSSSRTPSSRPLRLGPKSEASGKYLSSLPGLGRMKSILRRPQFFADDVKEPSASKPALGFQGKSDVEKKLPPLPGTPASGTAQARSVKRVGFTPAAVAKSLLASPSPAHVMVQRSPLQKSIAATVTYPLLPELTVSSPDKPSDSAPGDFTFRPENKLNFAPTKTSATIRAVRPSIASVDMGLAQLIPTVPHGLPNKKRTRDESDDSEAENREPEQKKQRVPREWIANDEATGCKIKSMKSRLPSPGKKTGQHGDGSRRILSLRRLNALARPKDRKDGET